MAKSKTKNDQLPSVTDQGALQQQLDEMRGGGIDHAAEQAAVDEIQDQMNSHDGDPVEAPTANGKTKESKAERFKRLANRRVPKMVKAMNVVANLGNTSQYEYTEEQRAKLLALAEDACKRLRSAFGPKEVAPVEALLF